MKHSETPAETSRASDISMNPFDETRELEACLKLMRTWVDERGGPVVGPMAQEHLDTGGKYLRARLALRAGHALEVATAARVAWAAACELAHNATLVHDDLQDGDTHRRGAPTCWKRHGMAQAINVGDLLLMLPTYGVAKCPDLDPERRLALCHLLADRMSDVISGQGLECQMTAEPCPDTAAYEAMVAGKTSALFEMPVLGAALAAGISFADAEKLAAPFGELGIVFQMQDDFIDLVGDKGREEVGSDLKEGKVSAVVVRHIADHPESREDLLALLLKSREKTSHSEVRRAISMFVEKGTMKKLHETMQARSKRAEAEVDARLSFVFARLAAQILGPLGAFMRPADV